MVFLCPYVLPVYLLPFPSFWGFCGFPHFDQKRFRALGGVASRKWRHHSIPRPYFCTSGLLKSCVHLFPFKSYSTFSFWAWNPSRGRTFGGFVISRHLSAYVHQRDPKKAPPCVEPRRLSHHACFCDAPFDRYAIVRPKIFLKKISKEKKSQSRYISRMRGGALIQPIAIEVCTSV
jgi:hypothetical protein